MEKNENQNTEISIKKHFFTVTPFSKYLAMALFVILPFVGFWMGFKMQINDTVNSKNISINNDISNVNNSILPRCTGSISSLPTFPSLVDWVEFKDGFRFTIFHPENVIVEYVESRIKDGQENAIHFYKITDQKTKFEAIMYAENLAGKSQDFAGVIHEVNSGTFWENDYGDYYSPPHQCIVNDESYTMNGYPVGISGRDDVGSSETYYVIPVLPNGNGSDQIVLDCYLPVEVNIIYSHEGSGFDYNKESDKEFQFLLEQMIQTINIKGGCKG